MSAHTEGRLRWRDTLIFFADNAGGFDIRDCPAAKANARRLAACWNALDGIDIETIEQFRNTAPAIELDRICRERDELVDALRDAEQFVTGNFQLQCLPAESDRGCLSRVKSALTQRIVALLAKHTKAGGLVSGQHTPGPWTADEHKSREDSGYLDDPDTRHFNIRGGDLGWVLAVTGDTGEPKRRAERANALLIAAAPDLLASLEAWLEHRSAVFDAQMRGTFAAIPSGRIDEIIDAARAAVAKARGEQ